MPTISLLESTASVGAQNQFNAPDAEPIAPITPAPEVSAKTNVRPPPFVVHDYVSDIPDDAVRVQVRTPHVLRLLTRQDYLDERDGYFDVDLNRRVRGARETGVAPGEESSAAPQDAPRLTLASVVDEWRSKGASVFIPTGIEALDDLFGGKGLPLGRRCVLVGAPGAGKTALAVAIADAFDRDEQKRVLVGFMAVDEEAEQLTYRFAQMAGCDRELLEARDPHEMDRAQKLFADSGIVFYNFAHTLDFAVDDLARRAKAAGKVPAMFVDSLNTTSSEAGGDTARESIEANIKVLERANKEHGMFVLATTESNRAAYADTLGSSLRDSKAAGAESRKIEYSFETNLVLQANPDNPEVTAVDVAKNRKYKALCKFALKLNRATHQWESADSGAEKASKQAAKAASKAAEADAKKAKRGVDVAREIAKEPGIGKNDLRTALRATHGSYSDDARDAGLAFLGLGVVRRPGSNNSTFHYLSGSALPPEVLAAAPELASVEPPAGAVEG
jgi:KaiC